MAMNTAPAMAVAVSSGRRLRSGGASAAAKLEQAFVAQLPERAQDGVAQSGKHI